MQFEWNSKDDISFGLCNDVIENEKAQFFIWLESENREIDFKELRTTDIHYRFNNFSIKEDHENNLISFSYKIAGCPAYFRIKSETPFQMNVLHVDGTPGEDLMLQPGDVKINLDPVGMRKYTVSVEGELSSNVKVENEKERDSIAGSDETVPEFFGGSFTSSTETPSKPVTSDSTDVMNNSDDTATIFTGDFNSDENDEVGNETVSETQQTFRPQQSEEHIPNPSVPFFAGMFSTTGGEQGPVEHIETVDDVVQETAPSKGNSGFSVPFVETEGIRKRKEKVKDLQQDNDRMAQEVENLEKQIADLESRSRELSDNKNALISHLEVLQREFDKDYSQFQADVDEIKSRYTVDETILDFYKECDPVAIEELIKQTDEMVKRVEEQIRLFVTAQQNKSDSIEKALKVGKKE